MIERGDKIAFVGKNGEGKSTLVKCIMKEIEHDGTLTIGHNVMIGYFAQNQASLLDENLTVFQTIDDVAQGDIRNKIKDLLGAFMFGGENSAKKSEGFVGWRAHAPGDDQAAARTSQPADSRRADQPFGHENERYPETGVARLRRYADCGVSRP